MQDVTAIYVNKRHEEVSYAVQVSVPRADVATVILTEDCPTCGKHTLDHQLSVWTNISGKLSGPGLPYLNQDPAKLALVQAEVAKLLAALPSNPALAEFIKHGS